MALHMPGSISMSRLKVYDTPAPDGQRGGTPHVHLVCTEMYFTLAGRGAVEIIDANGYSCVELQPYQGLVFSPGTIHRLINHDGDLEILVLMGLSGLPESGDNVVSFTETWLADDNAYTEAMRVVSVEDAYTRRDRGVEGFVELKAAFAEDAERGRAALARFYTRALERTTALHPTWRTIIEQNVIVARSSVEQLEALQGGDMAALFSAQHQAIAASDSPKPGFCGHLYRYPNPAALQPEGFTVS